MKWLDIFSNKKEPVNRTNDLVIPKSLQYSGRQLNNLASDLETAEALSQRFHTDKDNLQVNVLDNRDPTKNIILGSVSKTPGITRLNTLAGDLGKLIGKEERKQTIKQKILDFLHLS